MWDKFKLNDAFIHRTTFSSNLWIIMEMLFYVMKKNVHLYTEIALFRAKNHCYLAKLVCTTFKKIFNGLLKPTYLKNMLTFIWEFLPGQINKFKAFVSQNFGLLIWKCFPLFMPHSDIFLICLCIRGYLLSTRFFLPQQHVQSITLA